MKKQNRKNNKTPYLVVTLACALLVLGLGGNTLAKYITTDKTGSQSATVAKWGYVINISDKTLFAKEYEGSGLAVEKENGVAVSAASTTVAPGTTGSISFSVKGQAEVLSKLTFTASGSDVYYDPTATDKDEYYPIKWTLTEVDNVNNDDLSLTGVKLSEVVTALRAESRNSVEANTKIDSSYTLTWEWAFDNTALNAKADEYDTYLGNLAVGKTGSDLVGSASSYSTEVTFSLSITAQQIQKANLVY